MSTTALAVLMRWPQRGVGKSRLAAQIGVDAAHLLHRAFVADTLRWPQPRPRVLAVSGDGAALLRAQRAAPDATVVAQSSGDLGRRIAAALQVALGGDAACAVLVGTDSPSLPPQLLAACVDAARERGAAMVPAKDGGFIALAVARQAVAHCGLDWLHGGIDWSTECTAAQTVEATRRAGLHVERTAPWYDVDGAGDLDRLAADLGGDPSRAPHTLRALEALGAGMERVS